MYLQRIIFSNSLSGKFSAARTRDHLVDHDSAWEIGDKHAAQKDFHSSTPDSSLFALT
jgi:hypothetical protein